MRDKEYQVRQVNKELQHVEEKLHQNKWDLAKLEQMEQSLFELNRDSQRLFERLFFSWRGDLEFAREMEQDEAELQHQKRQVAGELETRKQEFLKVKQELYDLEDELHWLKRSLRREEE